MYDIDISAVTLHTPVPRSLCRLSHAKGNPCHFSLVEKENHVVCIQGVCWGLHSTLEIPHFKEPLRIVWKPEFSETPVFRH